MALTELEQAVADRLEWHKLVVVRPSCPDFLVYNPKTYEFCFVEVKRKTDKPSYNQSYTFKIMRKLGMPVIIVQPNNSEDFHYDNEVLKAIKELPRAEETYDEEEEDLEEWDHETENP